MMTEMEFGLLVLSLMFLASLFAIPLISMLLQNRRLRSVRCKFGVHKPVNLGPNNNIFGAHATFDSDLIYCVRCGQFSFEQITDEPGTYHAFRLSNQERWIQEKLRAALTEKGLPIMP